MPRTEPVRSTGALMLARLVCALLVTVVVGTTLPAAAAPVDEYASYQPQRTCADQAKPGTVLVADWLVRRFGGGRGPTMRPCGSGGVSEHKDGRAFDWVLDARDEVDRERARDFLEQALSADARGNADAKARRMGIMYIVWDDQMYASYDGFEPRPYLSSSCPTRRQCSATLRHRDHLHLSLGRPGARGRTSWYVDRGR